MGDLNDLKKDPICIRKTRLKELLTGRGGRRRDSEATRGSEHGFDQNLLNNEMLLDALKLLYDECSGGGEPKDLHMKYFVNKFGSTISQVQDLQVNVSDFRIGDIIRRGTYGNIHLAKEKSGGGVYTIKVVDKFQANIQRHLPLIDTEFNVLSKVASRWVVDLKYAFQDQKRLYFVMEYVSGGDLLSYLQRMGGKLSEDDAKFYLAELVLALNVVHSMGFVHRDIKPANVLLDKIGHIKLSDFNSASRVNQLGRVISAFTVPYESQQYVAPEVLQSLEDSDETLCHAIQLHHEVSEFLHPENGPPEFLYRIASQLLPLERISWDLFLGVKSKTPRDEVTEFCYGVECDYWSLGIIAYELAYGESPFLGDSSLATFNKIMSYKGTLNFPSQVVPVSDEYTMFIKELLTNQGPRIGFEECLRHSVFYNIIWDALSTEVPPYIPPAKDDAALSNLLLNDFSGIAPDAPGAMPLPNVPFIGFTKTLKYGNTGPVRLLNRTFNASSSFADSPDNSIMVDDDEVDKEDICARLQTELHTKCEILRQRSNDMQSLKVRLTETEDLVIERDTEIAKLNGELKRLKCESTQLSRDLTEEREFRQQIKNQSVDLVAEIKNSQQKKVTELEADLEYQRSIISKRENNICDLEAQIAEFRLEIQQYQADLQKAQATTGQLQQKAAKSYRGSISMMESRLLENSSQLEDKIQDMNVKHEEELHALQNALKRQEENITKLLADKDFEIEQLKGRLEESRSSREGTLEEMRLMRKKYDGTIANLETCLKQLMEKNEQLENERDSSSASSTVQEMLQTELEQTRQEKTRLSYELQQINKEAKLRQDKIDELDRIVKRLEGSLQGMESQKNDLMDKMREMLQRGQDVDVEKGASQILQEQLEKSQLALDSTRELLFQQREKVKGLEKQLSAMEMEHNGVKVDLRITIREKKELDEKITKQQVEVEESVKKLAAAEESKKDLEKKHFELEKEMLKLNTKIDGDGFELKEMNRILSDRNSHLKNVEADLTKALEEVANMKAQLTKFDKLQADFDRAGVVLKERERMIDDKDRKIANLIANVDVLKQALNVLDNQLKEFEQLVAQKSAEIEKAVNSKIGLESENASLKDELKKSKCDTNEAKSMRLFVEKKLQEVELSLKREESASANEVKGLEEKLEILTEKCQELSEELDSISARFEESEVTKEYLTKLVDSLRKESNSLKEEASRTITQMVKLKESNIQLSNGLEEAINKCEGYKNRVDSMNDELLLLECEKNESETKLQSMLQQQIKLIEYLQSQNEMLSTKKKKTFADRIFGRDKEKETKDHFSTPASVPIYNSTPMKETPRRVLHEQNVVKNLEGQANKLRSELESLKRDKQHVAQAEPAFKEVKKDEVPMKMDRNVSQIHNVDSEYVLKKCIFEDEGPDRLVINCVKNVFGELFLLGCEQGLFSTRIIDNQPGGRVKIDGVGPVYQMEVIPKHNLCLMIEGESRGMVSVHLGLLRTCAEAASCSKPKVKLNSINEQLASCNLFQIQKTASRETVLIVVTDKNINILFWDQDSFVLRKTVSTPVPVKGIITTPNSIIFGCERMFELDIKNFTMEEFVDESDDSLFYVTTSCQEFSSYPIAILDVGMSNLGLGETNYSTEYLLCFPDLAIFVDGYGRRSRPVDIVWSKLPVSVMYRHPNLYVVHLGSVEIIRLTKQSYTKTRVGLTKDSIGREVAKVPDSHFIYMTSPRLLGLGPKSASIVVGTDAKTKVKVFDLTLDEAAVAYDSSGNPSLPSDTSTCGSETQDPDGASSTSSNSMNAYPGLSATDLQRIDQQRARARFNLETDTD